MGIKNKSHISGLSNKVDVLLFTELETLLGKSFQGAVDGKQELSFELDVFEIDEGSWIFKT